MKPFVARIGNREDRFHLLSMKKLGDSCSNGLRRDRDVSCVCALLPVSEKIAAEGLARDYGFHDLGGAVADLQPDHVP